MLLYFDGITLRKRISCQFFWWLLKNQWTLFCHCKVFFVLIIEGQNEPTVNESRWSFPNTFFGLFVNFQHKKNQFVPKFCFTLSVCWNHTQEGVDGPHYGLNICSFWVDFDGKVCLWVEYKKPGWKWNMSTSELSSQQRL